MDSRSLAVLLVLGSLLAVPTGGAQAAGPELTLQVQAPTAPVKPQVENPSFLVTATVSCAAVARAVSPTSPQDPVQVAFDFEAQDGVVVTGPQQLPVNMPDCAPPATTATIRGAFQLSILRSVPGLQALPAVAKARVAGTPEAAAPFTVTADYYTVSQAKTESKLRSCSAPCRLEFPVEITNFGNARTQYTFALANVPSGKWSVDLPEAMRLDSPNQHQGNATGQAIVVVHLPLGAHEGAIGLTITPASIDDPAKAGDPLTVNLLARNSSLASKATPGPALPVALLAVALAVVLRRRA